ncbi:MAG: hypothetical protein ACREQF_11860 [Candidatus Binataceae bacterium]
MALFGSIRKFIGGTVSKIAKPVLKAAPAALAGFATGGKAGALAGFAGSLTAQPTALPTPSIGQFPSVQTLLGQYGLTSSPVYQQQQPVVLTGGSVALTLTKEVFDIIIKLAQRLNIPIRMANAVIRIGRSIMAKLIRFVRATPGLSLVGMLVSLGLTAIEADQLISWYATAGKKRRRIRVTNVKALNRSVRRLEGFHRLSNRVELALAARGGVRRAKARRCIKCRKSPCCC